MKTYIKSAVNDLSNETDETLFDLATNPETSPVLLEQLVGTLRYNIIQAVAENPSATVSLLQYIIDRWSLAFAYYVASNRSADDDILSDIVELAYNCDYPLNATMSKVGSNRNASESTLELVAEYALSHHAGDTIRMMLYNPNLSADTICLIARHFLFKTGVDGTILSRLYRHPNTPETLKQELKRYYPTRNLDDYTR